MSVRLVSSLAELRGFTAQPKLTVIDFFAEWCGPCKMVAPKLADLAKQKAHVNFLKVDVDQAQDIAAEFQIRAMPTFVFLKNGSTIDTVQGADWNRVSSLVDEHQVMPPPLIPDVATLKSMSNKELLALMRQHHIDSTGLLEKQELIDALDACRK